MGPFFTGTDFRAQHAMDMVQAYEIGGVAAIPEPTSWLAMGSLLGLSGVFAYRRRQLAKQPS